MHVAIKIGIPTWEIALSWGDYHMARAIGRALLSRGHDYSIQILPEWDRGVPGCDVALHLMGRSAYRPKGGETNVIWVISHPAEAAGLELDRYDLILVASKPFAGELARSLNRPVHFLPQGTDPALFYPEQDPALATDLLFAGNSRGVPRRIVTDLLPCPWKVHIWGDMWDRLVDERYVRGIYFPYERLRRLYSSAAIVLNDHWDDMRERGFVSNRIFDALASGACVLSDPVDTLDELVGETVTTCSGRDDLHRKIEYLLSHPEERSRLGTAGRRMVLENHTIASRVDEILRLVEDRGDAKRPA